MGEAVEVGGQHVAQHEVLLVVLHLDDVGGLTGEGAVGLGEGRLTRRVHEQPAEAVEEVVAGGAVDRPRGGKLLAGLEDLLDHQPGAGGGVVQPPEVALGITKAVGVVDAQPVDHALRHPVEHQGVGVGEDLFVFHPQRRQRGDVEEAAVVELAPGGPPVGQAVVLAVQEGIEEVGVGVDAVHGGIDGGGDLRPLVAHPGQRPLEHLLVAVAVAHADSIGGGRRRQGGESGGQELQLVVVTPARGGQVGGGQGEGQAERRRGDGEPVLEVGDVERAALALEDQPAGLEDPAVVVAEYGDEHGVAQLGLGALPVHVEVGRPPARRTVLQHVAPPGVAGGDGHVVGHDVEYLAETGGRQR